MKTFFESPQEVSLALLEELEKRNYIYKDLSNYDPILDLIDTLAVFIFHTQGGLKDAIRNNSIETAVGVGLDRIGRFFDLKRKAEESDEAFRRRILLAAKDLSGRGTRSSLLQMVLKFNPLILDAFATNSLEDPVFSNEGKPGLVFLYPHFKKQNEIFLDNNADPKFKILMDEKSFQIAKEKDIQEKLLKTLKKTQIPLGTEYLIRDTKRKASSIRLGVNFFETEKRKDDKLSLVKQNALKYFSRLESKLGKEYSFQILVSNLIGLGGIREISVLNKEEADYIQILTDPKKNEYISLKRKIIEIDQKQVAVSDLEVKEV